jgi:hypothetical protein
MKHVIQTKNVMSFTISLAYSTHANVVLQPAFGMKQNAVRNLEFLSIYQ